MSCRHIAVLTGKRGGYGAMKPLLTAIQNDSDFHLSVIVTDQHLNPTFGKTITEIEKDYSIACAIDIEQIDDNPKSRIEALGLGLQRFGAALGNLAPDILCLYGDRGEVLMAGVAAVHLGIPIAHLQGGDVTGNIDELMRHALTKLAHLHFPSTEESATRILQMGEESWRVHMVGDNHVDPIVSGDYTGAAVLRDKYGIHPTDQPIIVLQHPETIRRRNSYADMKVTLEAVLKLQRRTFLVYPCSDHGYKGILKAIDEVEDLPLVSVHRNIDAPDFWGLQAIASIIVGNSSCSLIEAPYFRLPAVVIGERQLGRKKAENVIECDYSSEAIESALARAISYEFRMLSQACSLPFGDGYAWKRILDELRVVKIGPKLINKRLSYA